MPKITPATQPLERAKQLVRAFGRTATCWQILSPELAHWFADRGDAVVGYATHRRVRVVAGEPVCAVDRLEAVCRDFERQAAAAGEQVCYLAAEREMAQRLQRLGGHAVAAIGAQPIWHPAALAAGVQETASLRHQLNRARNKGLIVSEWPSNRFAHPGLQDCLAFWLAGKPLPVLGFMTDPYLLSRPAGRRLWVAQIAGAPVGYAVLTPVPARKGWLVEQIVRGAGAPNGAAESLVAAAAQAAALEGSCFITLGASPLSRRGAHCAPRPPLWFRAITSWMRAHGTRFYNFRGLEHFKAKFNPQAWEPVFAVCAQPHLRLAAFYAVMGAFTGHSPVLAALQAMGHGLAIEIRRLRGMRP